MSNDTAKRSFRIGIDVGGTHTKAVAVDNATSEVVAKASVKTTHDDKAGVAAGVVRCFQLCLEQNGIDPSDIVFIAHSTTQATNALLEGDVAKVGVLGVGRGLIEGFFARRQTRIPDIPLGTGRVIRTAHVYLSSKEIPEKLPAAIGELKKAGAGVIVASKAFGVDDMRDERMIKEESDKADVPCTMASDITKLYGLTTRTRTAVINASILPKMLATANSTNDSVRAAGVKVPLMIMRGDGGVMDIDEMRKRPVLTMLSGPAASVVGSLLYLRSSNGIYFEVGGTSVNIGVIKNGRPAVDYSILGGHRTYINSLDVRVLGVAGGSMVRAAGGKLTDVGPRSAHIAGLDYAAFTPPEELEGAELEFFQPKPEDPADYVAVKGKSGKRVAVTNTCAANALGIVTPEYFAYGDRESCVRAIAPLAKFLGVSVEEAAKRILQKSSDKIIPVIEELGAKYRLEKEQMVLVGVGGGAAALIPFTARRMDLPFGIPENAEVISSIGVALAMVRDVVERVIPNPSKEDIAAIKEEAKNRAIQSGAVPESVEVHIEIDAQAQKVRAIALGSSEVKTTDLTKDFTADEAKEVAAKSFGVDVSEVALAQDTDGLFLFTALKKGKSGLRIVDRKGFVKIQHSHALVRPATAESIAEVIKGLWSDCCVYKSDVVLRPDIYVCYGARIFDYSGIPELDQILKILETELALSQPDAKMYAVGAYNETI